MSTIKKQNFLQGASILMLSMVIVKIVGAIFKIPLTHILTITGMTYFTASYTLFTTIYALTVTGLATAVARMVAACSTKGRYRDCKKILKLSLIIFVILGLFGTLLMIVCARQFSYLIESPNSYMAILVMAPSIFFSCIMSAYRGYYEGLRNMTPTATSQVVEVLTKLLAGLLFAYLALNMAQTQYDSTGTVFGTVVEQSKDVFAASLPFASAGAMLGVTVSTLAGYLYMFIKYKRTGDGFTQAELMGAPTPVRSKAIVVSLLKIALPVTLSAVVVNLTSMIDLVSIMNRLAMSYEDNKVFFDGLYGQFLEKDQTMHEFVYGAYSMAIVIFNLVPAFTSLFAKSALPNVTTAWVSKNAKSLKINIESVIRVTSLIALPAGIGIMAMAEPIVALIYGTEGGTMESIPQSLRLLGLAAIFLSLVSPIYAVLQGIGRFDLPVKFMLVGATLKLTTNYILVGIPSINIKGAAIGTTLCYSIILVMCLVSLSRITKIKINLISVFAKPLAAALTCGATAYLIGLLSNSRVITILAILAAGVVYVISLLLFKALSKDDLMMLPKGERIVKVLAKYNLMEK